MRASIMNKSVLISKVILPVLVCFTLVLLFQKLEIFKYNSLYFTISSFGVVITLFNLKKIRYSIIINLISSVSLSFIVLFLSLFIVGVIIYFIEKIPTDFNSNYINSMVIKESSNIISIAILSPLLMFYSYKLLFKVKTNRYFKITATISILILLTLRLTKSMIEETYLFAFWQTTMVLALQLILYQEELKTLLRKKS
ncbi:hypothetical protein [Winogradskyella ursingii]|uniref:hypothetical protein n=1 Tax=Winogradskyella ursingii TaxID=2686079 RepID=UPI0015CAC35D|nr:hypothetical protein [Winogradskyella ursingii]